MNVPNLYELQNDKVISVLRGYSIDQLPSIVESLLLGGIHFIEIPLDISDAFNFGNAPSMIQAISRLDAYVGAGTVTTTEAVHRVTDAGATFIVSPNTNPNVINEAKRLGLFVISGAFTPTEVLMAFDSGSDAVKIFPASEVGPSYFKALRGPYPHIPLVAFGGINATNAREYLLNGACGIGVGGFIVNKSWVNNNEYNKIVDASKLLLQSISE